MEAGERKLVTVLFADLVGSTARASDEDPERVRARLERFYEVMAEEIGAAGGTVEKFAGDAVMAVFGAPVAQEDHAERALHTALSMRHRLAELLDHSLVLRIGVNTGEVVVGRPRAGSSFVAGDAVNVAARLEQAASPGQILAGERTAEGVRGAFEFDERTTVEVKGKSGGVVCYPLVRALSLMRPRGVSGLHRAFVGREAELERLEAAYRRAVAAGTPQAALVVGDAGLGKTRLVRELWERLGREAHEPLRRTGRCLPYGRGITYWPLGEMLKEHFGILDSDSPEAVRSRLSSREILGLTLGLDVAGDLHPLAARDRLYAAWTGFVGELVAERPLAVLVEDLHWAEDPLLDLLGVALEDVEGPLLVIATARPELLERPVWRGAETIVLEPLPSTAAEQMLEDLIGAELPEPLRQTVVGHAEGNPFFVEELIGTLIDQGVLERSNGRWAVHEPEPGFALPDSVQAVLAARIDLLGPVEKAALQAASVIGRIFWTGPIYELVEGEPDLRTLEHRDFVRRRSGSSMEGEQEYAFKHALTREVAYASLPKARRARLHADFAAWIERTGAGRDEQAALLAHHYAEAVRPEDADLAWAGEETELERLREKAVVWLRRAAELAIARYEIDDGLALLQRAIELEPSEVERSKLWREVGCANAMKYDGEALRNAMEESLRICTDRETCGETYALLAFHTAVRSGMWKKRPETELVDSWIERALELADPESATYARALLTRAYWHPERGDEPAREASAIADRLGDAELRSFAWMARAAAAFNQQRFSEACTWAERRFDLLPEISDPDQIAEIIEDAIPATAALGRLKESRRLAQQHVEISERLSVHHRVHGIALQSEVDELAGSWEAIIDRIPRIEELVAANAATPCVRNARTLLLCATATAYAGEVERSRELEQAASELRPEGQTVAMQGAEIRLAIARDELEDVERTLAVQSKHTLTFGLMTLQARLDGLATLREHARLEEEAPRFLKSGTYLEPFALRALGVVRDDESLIERAHAAFAAMGLDWHAAQTQKLLERH